MRVRRFVEMRHKAHLMVGFHLTLEYLGAMIRPVFAYRLHALSSERHT